MNKPILFGSNVMTREIPVADAPLVFPGNKLVRKAPSPMALEQRYMFDGAAVGDAVQVLSATAAVISFHVDAPVADAGTTSALAGDALHLEKSTDNVSALGAAPAEAE